MDKLDNYFELLWSDYIAMTPQAKRITDLFKAQNESIVNDHIALRTFAHPKVDRNILASYFTKYGYKECGDYHFEEKKLYAIHLEHQNPEYPKIFISELLLEKFSQSFQDECLKIINSIDENLIKDEKFLISGRSWNLHSDTYHKLSSESEYGAWLAAIGYRPNHFTVSVNHLNSFENLNELNDFLKNNSFILNSSGGEIKGSKSVLLEQSSTIADKITVDFDDTKLEIPSCYFEFAKRYPDKTGKLYQGFVANSADKIFESTNTKT